MDMRFLQYDGELLTIFIHRGMAAWGPLQF